MNRRERQIEELIEPAVNALGCRVWGVSYLAQGRHSVLRIYIEKPAAEVDQAAGAELARTDAAEAAPGVERQAGVSIDDCERVSRQVGELLDVEETISGDYTLEVSSPGLDRQLFKPEQYSRVIGEVVDVRLNFPFEGKKKFVGQLVGVEDNEAILQSDGEEFLLPIETIQKARVVPTFEDSDLPPGKNAREKGSRKGKANRQPEKNA